MEYWWMNYEVVNILLCLRANTFVKMFVLNMFNHVFATFWQKYFSYMFVFCWLIFIMQTILSEQHHIATRPFIIKAYVYYIFYLHIVFRKDSRTSERSARSFDVVLLKHIENDLKPHVTHICKSHQYHIGIDDEQIQESVIVVMGCWK